MKRVAAYVAQSQDYVASTDLARRVRVWHETIAPKLEEVERRGDFDVHDYGTKILSRFNQVPVQQTFWAKKNLVKSLLISTLDKVIYYNGTMPEARQTKLFFPTPHRLKTKKLMNYSRESFAELF
jgi:hypothetical protein